MSEEKGAMRSDSSKSKSRRRRRKNPEDPTASLPDDIFFNILSRLPVKSLCRCKAVSPRWRSLISHEYYSRKFPQTLPCLFYSTREYCPFKQFWHFTNVWEGPTPRRPLVSPSLSFLPAGYTILDCCNGMLLCRFSESNSHDAFRYVVCNPVEETTVVVLPDSGCGANKREAFLAFDPAFYPEFHVFEFVMDDEIDPYFDPDLDLESVVGANIYSSVTGAWNYKESGWSPKVRVYNGRCSFFDGFLHFLGCSGATGILAVDVKGEKWCSIPYPLVDKFSEFVGIYKDHLCYISLHLSFRGTNFVLTFWILRTIQSMIGQ